MLNKIEDVELNNFIEEYDKCFLEKNIQKLKLFYPEDNTVSKSRRGRFRVKRRTMKKKLNSKIVEFTRWIKLKRNVLTTNEIVDKVKSKFMELLIILSPLITLDRLLSEYYLNG